MYLFVDSRLMTYQLVIDFSFVKGTVSQDLDWDKIYIIGKLLMRNITAGGLFLIL